MLLALADQNGQPIAVDDLVAAARRYIERCGRRVTFAYALLDHVNDAPAQAQALARRIRGIQAHVNLIPYNPTAGPDLRRPSLARVRAFQRELQAAGVRVSLFVNPADDAVRWAAGLGADRVEPLPHPGGALGRRQL